MIVDLVRNDLGMVSTTGSVTVPELCVREEHPGLSHLVSTVVGQLRDGVSWPQVFEATFPPGSVSGAPKSAAPEGDSRPRTRWRAAPTVAPSDGWMPTGASRHWPWEFGRSGGRATRSIWGPGLASRGRPRPSGNGMKPN